MNKPTITAILLALVAMTGWAQTTVKGHVINERGENIEYVSIGIEEDSVGVISDAQGHLRTFPIRQLQYPIQPMPTDMN